MHAIEIFEQPLNERYRLFLRMEQIFNRLTHHLDAGSVWDTHAILHTLLDLQQTLARGDSRQEIIRELERQRSALSRFESTGAVDGDRLHSVLAEQEKRLNALHRQKGTLGQELRSNDLLNQLQQRGGVGGRPVAIEVAGYQEWLSRPVAERHASIRTWIEPLAAAHAAVTQCLELTRDSADWETVSAPGGYHERALPQNQTLQLLRIRMSGHARGRFPEISAGRQRISIRFFEQSDPSERATQSLDATSFELACCGV